MWTKWETRFRNFHNLFIYWPYPTVQWHLVEKARFTLYFHWFGNYSQKTFSQCFPNHSRNCMWHTTFHPECSSRYPNPIHMFGAKMLVWEKENKSLFETSPIQWSQEAEKKLIVMHQFYTWLISRATSTKRYLSGLEASKTGPPQILCEIEINKEHAP